MWVLNLAEPGGPSYGMYFMQCHSDCQDKVETLVREIIEAFEAKGCNDWDVSDISRELNARGYTNSSIDYLRINV